MPATRGEAGAPPPGSELPRERQTARMVMRPLAFLGELRERHGDVFSVHVVDERPWVVVADPDLVAQIFKAPADRLQAGPGRAILRGILGGNSVMLLDGQRHMEQRRLLLPPFGGSRVERYGETMRAAAEEAIEGLPTGVETAAAPWTRAIALEVILRAVFGAGGGERSGPLRTALSEATLPQNEREARAPAFRRRVRTVDDLLFAEIARRRAAARDAAGEDVLSLLLAARHEDGAPMSAAELRDELMTLLAAGYETTATTLAWALERLARNAEALSRVEAEAEDGGGPWTDAAIRETLRARPALPVIVRTAVEPYRLGDHLLPAGATVMPAILLLHHDAGAYPDPFAFRPERFLGRQPDPRFWLPFGGGIRRCIGARFALYEMGIVLAALLRRFRVRAPSGEDEPMRRRDITLTPARGARLTFERR